MRVYVMSAFLVGDDLNLQYLALLNVLESLGPGPLIAPSTGLLQVLCAQYEVIQSTEGRVAEVRMSFIEAGSLATPVAITDFVSSIVTAVASGISGAASQFAADTAKTITRTLGQFDIDSNTPAPITDPATTSLNTQGDLYAPSLEGV
jgi:prophage DNA circulation protein